MAHKKGVGSSKNGRDSESKRLGVKKFGGERVITGNIIVRQKGTKVHPGNNVGMGKDYTLFALTDGVVKFETYVNLSPYIACYSIMYYLYMCVDRYVVNKCASYDNLK